MKGDQDELRTASGADDAFRFLEAASPETAAWESEHDSIAVRVLREAELYPAVVAALTQTGSRLKFAPQPAGPYWFRIAAGSPWPIVTISRQVGCEAQVLFDPATCPDGPLVSQIVPSPGGRFVAVILSATPSAPAVIRVVDAERAVLLDDRIEINAGSLAPSLMAWLPDESAFFYIGGLQPGTRWGKRGLFRHALGCDKADEREPLDLDDVALEPQVSADGRYLLVLSGAASSPRPAWIKDLHGGAWRSFLPQIEGRCRGLFFGNRYVAIVTEGASRGRLVSIPVDTPADRCAWIELIGEGTDVMWSVASAGDRLLLAAIDDDTMRLRLVSRCGHDVAELAVTEAGAVGVMGAARIAGSAVASATAQEVVFTYQNPTSSAALYRYDIAAGSLELLEPAELTHEHFVTRRLYCEAADGTRIPIQVTHRRDVDLSHPRALLLTAYGGFGVADLPLYLGSYAPFVQAGGIFAWATIRGGGEFGEAWHRGGTFHHKQTSCEDFCSAAEYLIAAGLTTSDRLAIVGASNGGWLVSAALVRRPQLFRAAAALIPFTDLMRYDQDELAARWLVSEWGDPNDPVDTQFLRGASPYQGIREMERYPALLVVAAERDDMSPPWHARKFAARLLGSESRGLVLFRLWRGFGHIEAAAAPPSYTAEWLSFLMSQVGLQAR